MRYLESKNCRGEIISNSGVYPEIAGSVPLYVHQKGTRPPQMTINCHCNFPHSLFTLNHFNLAYFIFGEFSLF